MEQHQCDKLHGYELHCGRHIRSVSVSPTVTTTYSVTCTGTGGALSPASATVTVTAPVPTWTNTAIRSQTGIFTFTFDAVPAQNSEDTAIALSQVSAAAYSDMATIARFSDTGVIDARNGGVYAAAVSVPYTAGSSYHFREVVNVPSHTYSTYVTPPGQSEITLGSNYAFRTEQAAAMSLNYSSKYNLIGDANVTNVTVTTSDTTPPMLRR